MREPQSDDSPTRRAVTYSEVLRGPVVRCAPIEMPSTYAPTTRSLLYSIEETRSPPRATETRPRKSDVWQDAERRPRASAVESWAICTGFADTVKLVFGSWPSTHRALEAAKYRPTSRNTCARVGRSTCIVVINRGHHLLYVSARQAQVPFQMHIGIVRKAQTRGTEVDDLWRSGL